MIPVCNSSTFQIGRVTGHQMRRVGQEAARIIAHLEVVINLVICLRIAGDHER